MTEPAVYLVAYMDGAWDGYDPLSPEVDYSAPPANAREIERNLRTALDLMSDRVDGRFVFAAHTGVYCRELFYEEPLLSLYRELAERGGELALHPHEEVVGERTLVTSSRHMHKIILEKAAQLRGAGVPATAYRGGYGAFARGLTPLLEEVGIGVELSAAPGRENRLWSACWSDAAPSAFYLCSEDPAHGDCDHPPSRVLEIPLGWDGAGTDLAESYLWNEIADLESMKRTWERILARHENTGQPQFVHALSHLFAMGHPDLLDRWAGFLTHAQQHGAHVVTPSQARSAFNRVASSATSARA